MQNTDKWLSLTKPGEMLQTVFLKSLCCYRRVVENSFPKLWPKKRQNYSVLSVIYYESTYFSTCRMSHIYCEGNFCLAHPDVCPEWLRCTQLEELVDNTRQ